jgi:hypothetical protein
MISVVWDEFQINSSPCDQIYAFRIYSLNRVPVHRTSAVFN